MSEFAGGQLQTRPENITAPDLANHIKQEFFSGIIRTGVDSTISGQNFSESLKDNLQFGTAAVFGAQFSQAVGTLIKAGEINKAQQLISHALIGCVSASIGGASCGSAATGSALGEAVSDLAYNGLGNISQGGQQVSMSEFHQIQKKQLEERRKQEKELQKKLDVERQFKASHNSGMEAPSHVGYGGGNVFPIPQGALGPFPTRGKGVQYIGGRGGNGLPSSVNRVRFMDEVPNHHPKRVVYMSNNQAVSPTTGKPIGRSHPENHLNPFTKNY